MSDPGGSSPLLDAPGLAERLAQTDARIAEAVRAAGRDPGAVTRVVITKFHPAGLVRELAALGVRDVGESRHQEASAKAGELADLDLVWHFVGQLQSKKARQVRRYAHVLHSLDRDSVVDALAEPGEEGAIDAFLQLNLTDDPARGGVAPADAERLAERIAAAPGLRLLGVMAVAPLDEEPRRAFARVRETSERVAGVVPGATAISAGMSQDFAEAVLEGATHLRIGTAITGKRPDRG
jgi:PLP dependent protein